MSKNQLICREQFIAIGFLSLLSPIIRTVPSQGSQYAGVFAWLSVFVATVPLAMLLFIMLRLQHSLAEGEGIACAITRILGRYLGTAVLIALALWLIFYCGFIMRSSADRFVSTIYPNVTPLAFIPCMAILALITSLGSVKALGRSALFITPILVLTLALVFIFALPNVDYSTFYLPVSAQTAPILLGALPIMNAVSISCYFAFLEGFVPHGSLKVGVFAKYGAYTLAITLLLIVCTIGSFGAEMTAEINNPFFVMIRNLRFGNSLERIEALVIAVWFFTDYVLISALIHVCTIIICICFKKLPRRAVVWLCCGAATAVAVLLVGDIVQLAWLSFTLVPSINMAVTFGLFPMIFAVGVVRRRV